MLCVFFVPYDVTLFKAKSQRNNVQETTNVEQEATNDEQEATNDTQETTNDTQEQR